MTSGSGEGPPTNKGAETLRKTLEARRKQKLASSSGLGDPGRHYRQLVTDAGFTRCSVWYRAGDTHELIAFLGRVDKNALSKFYKAEVELQKQFPSALFDFQFGDSPLASGRKAELEGQGYKCYDGA